MATNPPRIKRPRKSDLLRSMNRDLLLGLLIPGPDRFEVRGWVRWLLGNPHEHVPSDDRDRARFQAINAMDTDQIMELHDVALAAVSQIRGIDQSGAHQRGVEAHDHLMRYLLTEATDESVQFAAYITDTDKLLTMLDIDAADLDDPQFLEGFQWANTSLAETVAARLQVTAG